MASKRQRAFCEALHAETGDRSRWTAIMTVAKRLKMDEEEAILLAAECAAADLVRLDVQGPPYRRLPASAILAWEGWMLLIKTCSTSSAPGDLRRLPRSRLPS